jgi:glycosyltransferase involved in cell wall biosynthesis
MRIVQAVFGVFHHFELARELHRRGHLEKIYSTWPWARLKREGLPHDKVETFPWLHTPDFLLHRIGLNPRWLSDNLGYQTALTFDRWTDRRLPACDALIAISGAGLKTGQHLQARGGKFICDRGSTHQRYQAEMNREEGLRWGLDTNTSDSRDTAREEQIYDVADAITVPSTYSLQSFVEMGVPRSKMHLIPYGVRLESFARVADPAPDTFEVIYIGAVNIYKGFPYLLEAFAQLRHPKKRLRMVGLVADEMRPLLEKLPRENVEFLGHVPQLQLKELLSRSHVLVLPSIDDGFGMVMNQAMACGCPVIASTHTGAPDLLTEGQDGFLVPIRDSEAILNRLQQLADDPALQREMGANALAKVKTAGGWEQYGDTWERLLQRLTQQP